MTATVVEAGEGFLLDGRPGNYPHERDAIPGLGLAGGPEPDVRSTLVLPGRAAFTDLRSRVDFRHWPETAFEDSGQRPTASHVTSPKATTPANLYPI